MPPYAIETEALGRIYKIRGIKKDKAIRREMVALADVNLKIDQGELFGLLGQWCGKDYPYQDSYHAACPDLGYAARRGI